MGYVLLYVKFENPEAAFTHTLNNLRYYINCGIVVIICISAFLLMPNQRLVLASFLCTIPLHLLIFELFPDMNYFVRAMWVILIAFALTALPHSFIGKWYPVRQVFQSSSGRVKQIGWGLVASLVLLHVIFPLAVGLLHIAYAKASATA